MSSLKETKKLCEELYKYLDKHFEYGVMKDGKLKTHPSNKDITKYYRFQSPNEFEKNGGGLCADFTEYEEKWLTDHGISCRKFYVITETPPDYDSHTYVVIPCEDKFIWVEWAMQRSEGVHVFNSLRDVHKLAAWGCFTGSKNKEHLNGVKYSVLEYTGRHPEYGCSMEEFMDWMSEQGKWVFDDMAKKEKPQVFEEAATLSRRGVSGWKHTDATYEEKKNFERAMSFNSEIVYLRKEMNHMTKREIVQRLASLYNKLAEIYDTLEEDYTEVPMKTSRLGFARKPEKRKMSHRQYIDRLIYEIRDNIVELNRHFNRDGVKTVIQKMMDVWEYEKRELHINDHIGDKLVGNLTEKASHKILDKIMDSYVDKFYRGEIFEEAKLSSDDRNDLDDSQFGIPSLRKYPLTDKKHVLQAVRFFNKAPSEYKEELAKNIVKRAKELGMDWENWESLKPYLDKKVQEADQPNRHTIKKVKDFPFDKVYFGMDKDVGDHMDLDRPLFVTPYKGLASIFASSRNPKVNAYLRGSGYDNRGYEEWGWPADKLKDYLKEVHMLAEGAPDLKQTTIDCVGYVYEIDMKDVEGYIGKYPWMDQDDREYLICGQDEIKFKPQEVHVKMHIKGVPSRKKDKHVQEAVYYLNPDNGNLGIMTKTPKPVKDPSGKGKMYEMDEIIVPFIRLANKKGYKTRFCCSGHGPVGRVLDYKSEDESEFRKQTNEPYIFFVDNHEFKQLPPGWYVEKDMKGIHDYWGKGTIIRRKMKHVMHGDDYDDWQGYLNIYDEIVDAFKALCRYFEKLPDISNKHVQEAVDINSLRQQCGEVYQQALQIHYGCLDENGERITASPFKDSWKMIATYHSQSIQSMEETKLGVCFEHSFYVAKLLKDRGLPCQTFFLNCNIDHTQPPEEDVDIRQESESIAIEQHNMNNMSFWHQFTIVPNDTDSVVLIETSLTPEKNGVFLVRNMDDAVQHLIQTFGLNLSSQDFEVMKQDLIDVSSFEPHDGDTYIGYIDQAYLNGKFIKNEIRINHQTKTMKTYWDYLKEHGYLSEDGVKINEQIQQMDDNTAFDIINLLNANQLFTEEGLKFHQAFFTQDKPQLSVSEMKSQLKGFVQESYLPNRTNNTLKEKYHYIPLTPRSKKKYQDQGVFRFGLRKTNVDNDTKGAIYIDENHVVVAYVAIEKKTNGQRWITALEVSEEFQGHHYGIDLLQIAVDDFGAEYLSVNKKNKPAIHMYHKYGWSTYDETDKMFLMKLQEGNDLNG